MANSRPINKRLAASFYLSPYSRSGAPGVAQSAGQQDDGGYSKLRGQAISTLEAMGFDPDTMAERGVTWAEDQDPFGHVMHSQFMHYFGLCWQRVWESYEQFLSDDDYAAMLEMKTVVPVIQKYELHIKRQLKYPDSVIVANREDKIQPTSNHGTTVIFSLQQQAVIAQCVGNVTFINPKTGRPVDVRTGGPGFQALYDGFTKKAEVAGALKAKWEKEHPPRAKARI